MKLTEVNGDLKIGKGATIVAENDTITINGKIRNKGGFKCKGNLVARSIESDKGSIKVFGDLTSKREVEADRRRHRQLLRKNKNIKPNKKLAEKYRFSGDVKPKKSLMKKGKPLMGRKGESVDDPKQLLYRALQSKDFKVSDNAAERIMKLGGY